MTEAPSGPGKASAEDRPYVVANREVIAETPEFRAQIFTLGEGHVIPWHWHSHVSDVFIGMTGVTVVETRAPRARFEIGPGERCTVPAKRAHQVSSRDGMGSSFAILQGVGAYDFNRVGG